LDRAGDLAGLGVRAVDCSAVPPNRMAALARHGLVGKAAALAGAGGAAADRDAAGDGPPPRRRGERRRAGPVRAADGDAADQPGAGGVER